MAIQLLDSYAMMSSSFLHSATDFSFTVFRSFMTTFSPCPGTFPVNTVPKVPFESAGVSNIKLDEIYFEMHKVILPLMSSSSLYSINVACVMGFTVVAEEGGGAGAGAGW